MLKVAFVAALAFTGLLSGCATADGSTPGFDEQSIVAVGSQGRTLSIRSVDGMNWTAVLNDQSGERVVDSASCDIFRNTMVRYRSLPALKPGPYALQEAPAVRPIPPTRMDGERWIITASAFAPDWTEIRITLEGDQGPYPTWTSEAVRSIQSC
jgi:hypothetical protein